MATENGEKRKSDVEIRQMEIDDVAAVYHLGEELFTSEKFPILYRTWDPYEVTDYFTTESDYCLVAEIKGRIIGFILANTVQKEGTAWKTYGYLSWIGVAPQYQRTNLGQRLYNRLEDIMQNDGVRMVIADTEEENVKAIEFFIKMGFSIRADHVWLAKTLQRRRKKSKKDKENGN